MNHEKEYIFGNDFGDYRGDFVCTGNVHGANTGVECVPARSNHGSGRGSGIAGHGAYMEKDGKQGSGQVVWENDRRNADWHDWGTAVWSGYVPGNGLEQHGGRDLSRHCGNRSSPLFDSFYKRIKVITIRNMRWKQKFAAMIHGKIYILTIPKQMLNREKKLA